MKKIVAILLLAAMAVTLLAGCASNASTSTTTASASASASGSASASDSAASGITGKADLDGKKIGVQAGTTGETYANEEVKDAKVSSYKTGIDAALDLKSGAIDCVVLDILPAESIVKNNPDLQIIGDPLTVEEYCFAVRKGDTETLDAINATIERMKGDGSYDKLVAAFMPTEGDIVLPDTEIPSGDGEIIMGTSTGFAPFEYTEGTDVVGFDIEMSKEIAKDMGKTLKIEDMAFDSLLSALSSNVIDFIAAGMTATDERKQSVDFSEPYYDAAQVIIVKK